MTDEAHREQLIKACGVQLADQFRNSFTPAETLAILAATLDRVFAWMEPIGVSEVLADFRQLLDQIEKRGSTLH